MAQTILLLIHKEKANNIMHRIVDSAMMCLATALQQAIPHTHASWMTKFKLIIIQSRKSQEITAYSFLTHLFYLIQITTLDFNILTYSLYLLINHN